MDKITRALLLALFGALLMIFGCALPKEMTTLAIPSVVFGMFAFVNGMVRLA